MKRFEMVDTRFFLSNPTFFEMVNSSTVLWLQFAYLVWQFVRVNKYCRIPYAILVHTFMWLTGEWCPPFSLRSYLVLETGRAKFYVGREGANQVLKECLDRTDEFKVESSRPEKESGSDLAVISIPSVNYKLCLRESRINESFVWNYLRDKPQCFARDAELLLPNLVILDRVSDLEGLRLTCQGDFIPHKRKERVLALVDRERELNQNFMRLLSTIPLMAHALGYEKDSVWISVAVIVIDQLSQFFSWVWESVVSSLVYLFTVPMTSTYFRPQTRELLSTLSSIVSKRMKYSDQVRKSLILVRKGDVVYTTAPFNLADFEQIIDRRFKRERKTPEPYSEEKFGKFTFCGEEMEFEEGASVLTHYIAGSRIDSIFKDDGSSFYNFRNNEHLHFGIWKRAKDDTEDDEDADDSKGVHEDTNLVSEESRETEDSEETEATKSSEQSEGKKLDSDDTDDDPEDNFNNFQDLLQIMEEMQMLPFIQTEDADCKHRFRSLDFNEFVLPGRSLKDLTFLFAKN